MVSYDQMSPCWIWWSNTLSGHYWRHQNGVTSKKWHSHELHFSDIINDSCCVETCYKLAKKRQWNAGVDYICVNVLAKLLCWVVSGSSTHHDTLGNLTWYIKNPCASSDLKFRLKCIWSNCLFNEGGRVGGDLHCVLHT